MFTFEAEDVGNGFRQLRQFGLSPELVEVFQAMKIYTSMLEAYIDGSLLEPDLIRFCEQRNLIQHRLMSLPSANKLSGISLQERQIYELCRISGIIYSTGVIFPLPARVNLLPTLSRNLKYNLQACNLDLYLSLADLVDFLLWVMVMGGVTAACTREKAWYIKSLKKLAPAAELSQWPDAKQSLKLFLWLDNACDKAGQELWSEVEGDRISSQGRVAKTSQPTSADPSAQNRNSDKKKSPCQQCRQRKVWCDKTMPCNNCRKYDFVCFYDSRERPFSRTARPRRGTFHRHKL